ncbi:DinB family protein [Pseudalkalibacillus caeni]|uniref:DinB family protein n=1 Tax=Exobacillus caeni TaxID=2574798 RepID=A0A5R9F2E0_9BACL|nr:DinB family protein [Pseudalkalibacillus caeni]TLS36486.1 DinB family protein [Pseudalkalibacillus caeni]
MREDQLFSQLKMWRRWTVEYLRTIPEDIADKIPHGHNNSIRWNTGHILVGWDHTMFPAVSMERQMPESYHLMFPRGSKPESWTEQPPSMEELIRQLEEQPIHIEKACTGRLDEPLEKPFLDMKTVGDMILFHMNHESLHMGTIKSMKQILST